MNKIRATIYVLLVLWLAAGTQLAVNRAFMNDKRVIEAFADTKGDIVESRLELAADYGVRYLSEEDKKNLIGYLADTIGLDHSYSITSTGNDKVESLLAEKKGRNANTSIEVVSVREGKDGGIMRTRQYIVLRLSIYEKMDSILTYKSLLEKAVKELDAQDYQTLLTFTGTIEGRMSKEEIDLEVDGLLKKLQAKVVAENREENLYTIYAYTGLVGEYVKVSGSSMNINIAVNYDETTNKTNIYLATPVLNQDF